jgi:hypothetical protein
MSRALAAAAHMLATTLLAAAHGMALAADSVPAGAERVRVDVQRPEAFKGFKATCIGMDERTRGLLADLTQFIRATGTRRLPDGGALEITITDIDMAGEFETWCPADFGDARGAD